jgi:hypothetical protein
MTRPLKMHLLRKVGKGILKQIIANFGVGTGSAAKSGGSPATGR